MCLVLTVSSLEDGVLFHLNPPSSQFSVDRLTGWLTVTGHLDYETMKTHNLTIVATNTRSIIPQVSSVRIQITVLDCNDNPHYFLQNSYNFTG